MNEKAFLENARRELTETGGLRTKIFLKDLRGENRVILGPEDVEACENAIREIENDARGNLLVQMVWVRAISIMKDENGYINIDLMPEGQVEGLAAVLFMGWDLTGTRKFAVQPFWWDQRGGVQFGDPLVDFVDCPEMGAIFQIIEK